MPTYCFRDSRGKLYERYFRMSDAPESIWVTVDPESNMKIEATRDLAAELGGARHRPGNWPMLSDAAGVSPDQVGEATRHSREIGIPTEFSRDGRAVFTDRAHRKKYCEAVGLYDRNGGYSDPQRQ